MGTKRQTEHMNYAEMYYTVFRAATKAIDAIQNKDYAQAERLLCEAQQKTEQMYLEAEEE